LYGASVNRTGIVVKNSVDDGGLRDEFYHRTFPLEGGCDCRHVRYRMSSSPLFVHCCHCRWCQRETGASFALNAMIEADRVELVAGEVDLVETPSASGKGQSIARCPKCRIALWSHYAGAGKLVSFIRVGTLDDPDACRPTSTSSRVPSNPG
jgi:hypothetical protein